MRFPFFSSALALSLAITFSGCAGYHVGTIKPTVMDSVQRISVSNFRNDTLEPRMETLFANAVIRHLQQDGTYKVTAEQDADAIVQGTIERIERSPARGSRRDFYETSEYTLAVVAKIRATEKRTGRVLMERTLTGHSSFFVTDRDTRSADVNRDERQAIPLAVADLAAQAASYLSEGW